MSSGRRSLDLFPVAFQHAVWIPALILTLAIAALDVFLAGAISFRPVWFSLYAATTLFCLAPLLIPSLSLQPGLLRRFLAGLLLQLLIAAGLLFFARDFARGLLLANAVFVFLVLCHRGQPIIIGVSFAGPLLGGLTTFSRGPLDWTAGLRLLTGWVVYRVAFSRDLAFLEHPEPGSIIQHELRSLFNASLSNRQAIWSEAYASGRWQYLQSADQRPRHYVIAGLVRDWFSGGADTLDVGCGYATLYRVLGQSPGTYTGIDLSEVAIKQCHAAFKADSGCSFEAVSFEEFRPDRKFDVVVLNEVLYYFPFKSVKQVCQRARSLLKSEESVLIISMARGPKAWWIWRKLALLMRAVQSIRVTNEVTGNHWIVNVYRGA